MPATRLRPTDAEIAGLRRARDRARNMAFLGFGLLFLSGIVARFGDITLWEGRRTDWVALLGLTIGMLGYLAMATGAVLFVVGSLLWILRAIRLHRRADPWAYDPDLDGPNPHKRHELDDRFRDD